MASQNTNVKAVLKDTLKGSAVSSSGTKARRMAASYPLRVQQFAQRGEPPQRNCFTANELLHRFAYGRQFVDNPNKTIVLPETKQLIDRLLLERISLRGIARVTRVSWSWLQDYVNQKLACTPRQISLSSKPRGQLTIECDEMWSFVDSKKN